MRSRPSKRRMKDNARRGVSIALEDIENYSLWRWFVFHPTGNEHAFYFYVSKVLECPLPKRKRFVSLNVGNKSSPAASRRTICLG